MLPAHLRIADRGSLLAPSYLSVLSCALLWAGSLLSFFPFKFNSKPCQWALLAFSHRPSSPCKRGEICLVTASPVPCRSLHCQKKTKTKIKQKNSQSVVVSLVTKPSVYRLDLFTSFSDLTGSRCKDDLCPWFLQQTSQGFEVHFDHSWTTCSCFVTSSYGKAVKGKRVDSDLCRVSGFGFEWRVCVQPN